MSARASYDLPTAASPAVYLRMQAHLLPRAIAWRLLPTAKTLARLFGGLTAAPASARSFVDGVHADLFPITTRALEMWEAQFGLPSDGSDAERRLRLAAVWRAQGGQSPRYLQDVVQAAGFPLYIHEWWNPPNQAPRTARDPRTYTQQALIGSIQCGEALARCGEPDAECNRWLVNDVRYIQNSNLTPEAPAPIPGDSAYWPYFIYWGAEAFPNDASVPASRKQELDALLLKITPAHCWNVLLINWT